MSAPPAQPWTREDYERDARQYRASLRLEDIMEATPQAIQREATVVSFNELKSRLPGMGYFNELLVQKRHEGRIERAVPDNMVVLGDPGDAPRSSWAVEYEPCPVLWVLEYVSRENPEKDYASNFEKYEGVFKFPYYLLFEPEQQVLLLYHLHEGRYVPVEENTRRRLPIPELELEVGLLDGWVRFWFRGELLPVSRELRAQMKKLREQNAALVAQTQELTTQNTHLHAQLKERDDKLKERDEQLKERDRQLKEQSEQLKERDRLLKEQTDQAQAQQQRATDLAGRLRPVVEARARQVGRQDILAQLPGVTDSRQLAAWLAELG
jgi:Uma2 family endonuclease